MKKQYVIINKDGQNLSRFDSNDLATKHQLKFSTKHWYIYPTKKEAEDHLKYIKRECRQQKEAINLKLKKVI